MIAEALPFESPALSLSRLRSQELLQPCGFSFGLPHDRNVWVSVFPEGEEIRVDGR
jgi:hypothetical protein